MRKFLNTQLDLLLIHHLIFGTPLHLGNILFYFMLNAARLCRSAPYGMILTRIFKFFKIPLEDEQFVYLNNIFSLRNVNQMKLKPTNKPLTKESTKASSSPIPTKKRSYTTQSSTKKKNSNKHSQNSKTIMVDYASSLRG